MLECEWSGKASTWGWGDPRAGSQNPSGVRKAISLWKESKRSNGKVGTGGINQRNKYTKNNQG